MTQPPPPPPPSPTLPGPRKFHLLFFLGFVDTFWACCTGLALGCPSEAPSCDCIFISDWGCSTTQIGSTYAKAHVYDQYTPGLKIKVLLGWISMRRMFTSWQLSRINIRRSIFRVARGRNVYLYVIWSFFPYFSTAVLLYKVQGLELWRIHPMRQVSSQCCRQQTSYHIYACLHDNQDGVRMTLPSLSRTPIFRFKRQPQTSRSWRLHRGSLSMIRINLCKSLCTVHIHLVGF